MESPVTKYTTTPIQQQCRIKLNIFWSSTLNFFCCPFSNFWREFSFSQHSSHGYRYIFTSGVHTIHCWLTNFKPHHANHISTNCLHCAPSAPDCNRGPKMMYRGFKEMFSSTSDTQLKEPTLRSVCLCMFKQRVWMNVKWIVLVVHAPT